MNHVNQRKIGSFLRELRKEKKLTQEQLAEQLNVSARTVSRWENGNNMPDISIIVELAEFYSVSISEIIDGERNGEKMNDESRKIVDYTSTDKEDLLKRIKNDSAVSILALIAAFILWVYDYSRRFEVITMLLLLLSFSSILSVWMMSDGRIAEMRKNGTLRRKLLIGVIVLFSLTVAVTLLAIGIL